MRVICSLLVGRSTGGGTVARAWDDAVSFRLKRVRRKCSESRSEKFVVTRAGEAV